jgi:hypothetical protein
MAFCNDCGKDATVGMNEGRPYTVGPAPHLPCEAQGREHATEGATEAAQMHLDNDEGSYHDIQSIVNNSNHPVETSHLLGQYIRSLPSDHPLHQELKGEGWTPDDIDTDDWARQLHAERDLQNGEPVGRGDENYRRLLGRRRTAQGTPMLPGGQGTEGGQAPDMSTDMNTPNLPGAGPGDAPAPQMNDPAAGTPLSAPIQQGPLGLNPNQVTTKPRQMPGAGDMGGPTGGAPGMPMDFPPDINGANLPDATGPDNNGVPEGLDTGQGPNMGQGADPTAGLPDSGNNNLAQATALIRRANPHLSPPAVWRLARKASRYLAVVPPQRPEGSGEPLAPVRPQTPADRAPEAAQTPSFDPKAPKPEWYHRAGDPQHQLANAPVQDKNTLFQQRGR